MDLLEAIRAKAIRDALDPSKSDAVGAIFRWYSKTFHTPLHTVFDLPEVFVFRMFYEDRYTSMSEEELMAHAHDLLVPQEQRELQEKAEEDEFVAAIEAREQARLATAGEAPPKPPPPRTSTSPEPTLPSLPPKDIIKLTFVEDEQEFEDLLNSRGAMEPPED